MKMQGIREIGERTGDRAGKMNRTELIRASKKQRGIQIVTLRAGEASVISQIAFSVKTAWLKFTFLKDA